MLVQPNSTPKNAPRSGGSSLTEVRSTHYTQFELQERTGNDGKKKLILRGEFGWADKATENKRLYPSPLLMREFKRLTEAMSERRLYGELDHPSDSRTELKRVSHLITSLELTPDGIVVGEAEVLPTENGRALEALLRAGCRVGVSSRGFGSTKVNESGEDEVQEDFQLVTYDVVADPAAKTAYPDVFYEWLAKRESSAMTTPDVQAQIEAARRDAEVKTEARLKDEFSVKLLEGLKGLKDGVREEIRGEMLSDPSVAGAKVALAKVKELLLPFVLPESAEKVVSGKDTEIKRLRSELSTKEQELQTVKEELARMTAMAKEAGYRFYLERNLRGDPDAELILQLIGDVKTYARAEDLKAKVEEVREKLAERRAEEAKAEAESQAKYQELETQIESLKTQNAKLKEGMGKAVSLARDLSLNRYAEDRVGNSSQRERVRSVMESARPKTKAAVDKILESNEDHGAVENENVRARVRRLNRSGSESSALNEERSTPKTHGEASGGYNELDVELDELRTLSGYGN